VTARRHAVDCHVKISRDKIKTLGAAILSVLLAGYMIAAFVVADKLSAGAECTGMRVQVLDSSHHNFVTAAEIARELGSLPRRAAGMRLSDIDTEEIDRLLGRIDKIESVRTTRLSDGRINIAVTPLLPVARVFDGSESYYVNRVGKRISADARYHIDVPVIEGHFPPGDTLFTPVSMLPLLEWLDAHRKPWGELVTMIKVESPTDIILIPAITGHVINFGAPDAFDSKFSRLHAIYTKVMPVKGWNYYDTISVKWGGQVVATRRDKPQPPPAIDTEVEEETTDVTTMLTAEGVAPGRTRPGQKAHNEKPIPAVAKEKAAEGKKPQAKPGPKSSEVKAGAGNHPTEKSKHTSAKQK